jgi:hypothetical protein
VVLSATVDDEQQSQWNRWLGNCQTFGSRVLVCVNLEFLHQILETLSAVERHRQETPPVRDCEVLRSE